MAERKALCPVLGEQCVCVEDMLELLGVTVPDPSEAEPSHRDRMPGSLRDSPASLKLLLG